MDENIITISIIAIIAYILLFIYFDNRINSIEKTTEKFTNTNCADSYGNITLPGNLTLSGTLGGSNATFSGPITFAWVDTDLKLQNNWSITTGTDNLYFKHNNSTDSSGNITLPGNVKLPGSLTLSGKLEGSNASFSGPITFAWVDTDLNLQNFWSISTDLNGLYFKYNNITKYSIPK